MKGLLSQSESIRTEIEDLDFDSEDENSCSFTTARGESSETANSQQLPGIPDLNSTMTHQSLNSTPRDEVNERLKVLEQYCARPLTQTLDAKALGNHIARGVSNIVKANQGTKRSKSPDGAPEEPVVIEVKAEGPDDNHKKFCWAMRRLYKNPNARPEDYWAEAKYPLKVVPNLRGNLYVNHLIPMSMSAKALGCLHSVSSPIEIKYFAHSNRTNKRSKKEGLTITSGTNELGTTNYSLEEHWEEADSMKDLMDALWNLMAASFQIRPRDWTPMILGRVCHEVGYFLGCSNSKEQQKTLCEDFINKVLFKTRTSLGMGRPPLNYQ